MQTQRRDQHREFGGAVIELMLTAPILLLCMVAMVDFGRGLRAAHEGERAARHVAWAEARAREDGGHPGAGGVAAQHYRSRGTFTGTRSSGGSVRRTIGLQGRLFAGAAAKIKAFDFARVSRGALDYLDGLVEYRQAESGFQPSGLRLLSPGTVKGRHAVSIDSRPEANPSDPEGWWDPFNGEGGLLEKMRSSGVLPW